MADESKKKHHQIDPVFKQVVVSEFADYGAGIQTEVEVSRLPGQTHLNSEKLEKIIVIPSSA